MSSQTIHFDGADGQQLSGRIDLPAGAPLGWALFAHCFTCGKDVRAARKIAGALAESGWALLRFDFAGVGASDGSFADKTFASNVADLVAAADWLSATHQAPSLLVGHSWGGAAAIAAGPLIPEVDAVATIAAPSDPAHITHLFGDHLDTIHAEGQAEVTLAGRPFTIGKQLLDDVAAQKLEPILNSGGRAMLVLHSPQDELVPIEHATRLFKHARHPKSFVSLDGADHLLSNPADADWVGHLIAAWAARSRDRHRTATEPSAVHAHLGDTGFATDIAASGHRMRVDEPVSVGGEDSGPPPHDFVLAGLGACTAMTLRMYADRKKWPLDGVDVTLRINGERGSKTPTEKHTVIERTVQLTGPLDDDQRQRLLGIADRCPVHRTLEGSIAIETTLDS